MPIKVEDVMTPDPTTLEPSATVGDAYVLMKQHGFRHVPVVEGGALVGIVSITDIGRQGATVAAILAKRVDEIMTRNPLTIGSQESASVAAGKMASRKINCLLVVDDGGALTGIVTTYDLLDAFARHMREEST